MKKIIALILFLSAICYWPYVIFAAMNSSNYQIWSDTFSVGGGEDQTSDNYGLQDTLDQGISSGAASSTNYAMRVGYRSIEYFNGREVLSLSLSSGELDFGSLSKLETKTVSHSITVDTNSYYGIAVTFSGATLTHSTGSGTVDAIGAVATAAVAGQSQFGFNVIYSTSSPALPRATALAPYATPSAFAFSSGGEVINSTGSINPTTFIVNYIANISGLETAGAYSTILTYTATANF